MNKEEKQMFVRAALAGDKDTMERIIKSDESPVLVEMKLGKFCTSDYKCDCKNPDGCVFLKPMEELKQIYPKAIYIGVSEVTPETLERCKNFDMPAPEKVDPVSLRNELIKLKKKMNDE